MVRAVGPTPMALLAATYTVGGWFKLGFKLGFKLLEVSWGSSCLKLVEAGSFCSNWVFSPMFGSMTSAWKQQESYSFFR